MTMLQRNTTTGSTVYVVTRLNQGVSDCKSTPGPKRSAECRVPTKENQGEMTPQGAVVSDITPKGAVRSARRVRVTAGR